MTTSGRFLAAVAFSIVPVLPAQGSDSLPSLAHRAVSADAPASAAAVRALRAAGYEGLDALLRERPAGDGLCWSGSSDPARERWCAAVDAVAAQRDAASSRLYWYTDFEAAKRAASAADKPILSLALLGRLDEDLSCANSRFFRAALYADPEIAAVLRARFVLHWKSVRPAPRITIDFGDGRKLERTITGNSIHSVLAADGRPIDALPGLNGPQPFLAWLGRAEAMERRYAEAPAASRELVLHGDHLRAATAVFDALAADQRAARLSGPAAPAPAGNAGSAVPAATAMPVAATKMLTQMPLMRSLAPLGPDVAALEALAVWARLARLHPDWAKLSAESRALLARESPLGASDAAALRSFEATLAIDSVRNAYDLHRQIHGWFVVAGPETRDVGKLNDRVYTELFLTPASDPWLGLAPPDRYAAVAAGGRVDPP